MFDQMATYYQVRFAAPLHWVCRRLLEWVQRLIRSVRHSNSLWRFRSWRNSQRPANRQLSADSFDAELQTLLAGELPPAREPRSSIDFRDQADIELIAKILAVPLVVIVLALIIVFTI